MRAKADSNEIDLVAILLTVLKLVCSQGQMLRALSGTVWTTYLVKADDPFSIVMLEAGVAYDLAVKGEGAGHKWGPPHVHKWLAFCDQVAADSRVSTVAKRQVAQYVTMSESMSLSLQDLAAVCLHWKAKKCFRSSDEQEEMVVVTFAVAAEATVDEDEGMSKQVALQTVVKGIFEAIEATAKASPPPRGGT